MSVTRKKTNLSCICQKSELNSQEIGVFRWYFRDSSDHFEENGLQKDNHDFFFFFCSIAKKNVGVSGRAVTIHSNIQCTEYFFPANTYHIRLSENPILANTTYINNQECLLLSPQSFFTKNKPQRGIREFNLDVNK